MSDDFFNPYPDNHPNGYFALGNYVINNFGYKPITSNLFLQIDSDYSGWGYYPFVIKVFGKCNPTGRAVKRKVFAWYRYTPSGYPLLYATLAKLSPDAGRAYRLAFEFGVLTITTNSSPTSLTFSKVK